MAKPRAHTPLKKGERGKNAERSKVRQVKWGPTYQNNALRTLVAALNWAKGQEIISAHCLENP